MSLNAIYKIDTVLVSVQIQHDILRKHQTHKD